MGVTNLYLEKILGDTLIFNSVVVIAKNLFFLIFSQFILGLKILLDFSNLKNYFQDFKKDFFESKKKKIIPILEIKSKKDSDFIQYFLFVKSKIIQVFLMQTKKNFFYFFEYILDKDQFLLLNRIDVLKGLKIIGLDKISFYKDFFFSISGGNSILIGKVFLYPYFFLKIYPFLIGHKFLKKIKIHPLIVIFSANLENFYFYFIFKRRGKINFIQIGKMSTKKIFSMAYTKLDSKKEFFLAIINMQKIQTYKIRFTVKKEFRSIKLCGMTEFINTGNFLFLSWSEIFYKILVTGSNDGKIFLWNKILIPLIEIKNYWYSIKDIKIFDNLPIFVVVLKKERNEFKSYPQKKTSKNLPNSSIKIFIFPKNNQSNVRIIKILVYFLNFRNFLWFFDKIFKKERFKKNFLSKKIIISIIGKLSLVKSEKDSLNFNCLTFLSIKKVLNCYFSKIKKNYNFNSFFRQKFFFFRFFILSTLRNLSIQEVRYEQHILNDTVLKFFYYFCDVCQRITINFRKKSKIFCNFFHSCYTKYKGWNRSKNYFYLRKIENQWDFRKKLIQFPIYPRFIAPDCVKFLILQKEIWGIL